MSLVGKAPSDLHVTITVDASAVQLAFGRAVAAAANHLITMGPALVVLSRYVRRQQRHRVRALTRARQRRRW